LPGEGVAKAAARYVQFRPPASTWLYFLLLLSSGSLLAKGMETPTTAEFASYDLKSDTLSAVPESALVHSRSIMSKSPGLALGLSALIPGAGQIYNESYWKVPIILGLGGYFLSEWIKNNDLARDYRDQYEASKTPGNPVGNTSLLSIRDFYKDQRDTFTWYLVILYVANLIDAYVDASLYDFTVSDDLALRIVHEAGGGKPQPVVLKLNLVFR
jgi:hypothetical protein